MSIEWDIEELACKVLGKNEKEMDLIINEGTIDDYLFEQYGVDFEQYCEIVKGLLPFTQKIKAAISGDDYHAFVKDSCMIVKVKA